ncbi:SDR family NAD(P)-dependent oxidoreductase [Rathayibacter sp. VKM Ac-2929]|uniref:SDR family NAD(P)-dependent oxidoreductase n=1 Tax=Rathayibacter sp. VKM Ac-2929 TaxID=2929480 RepID=UPI001FB35B1D|nr:SDR family NAD(P)-dependent oxidoreductase [Rathayibacter sp. VKM Ac-2929]MCJ1675533.1 SDR family NAD(P)-dependent oxidoreductase [Rathayibacter sp. VKM Ac-2929]
MTSPNCVSVVRGTTLSHADLVSSCRVTAMLVILRSGCARRDRSTQGEQARGGDNTVGQSVGEREAGVDDRITVEEDDRMSFCGRPHVEDMVHYGRIEGFRARMGGGCARSGGDCIAGTARALESLSPLVREHPDTFLPVELDVTDRAGSFAAVQQTAARFGRLDVVVNNAGYGHFGMIEEIGEEEARAQLETNVLGALWVTQAALPIMLKQNAGHLIQVSSIGGITAFPTLGMYHASAQPSVLLSKLRG